MTNDKDSKRDMAEYAIGRITKTYADAIVGHFKNLKDKIPMKLGR